MLTDGSHILMGTSVDPVCKESFFPGRGGSFCPLVTNPTHLYMRVNNAISYDVSGGKPVRYVDTTPDGSVVYFTTAYKLTGDDTDSSVDLYAWMENGGSPEIIRVSAGAGGSGNTDACVASWTSKCGVNTYDDTTISRAAGNRGGLDFWPERGTSEDENNPNPGYTDNAVAADSGDILLLFPRAAQRPEREFRRGRISTSSVKARCATSPP